MKKIFLLFTILFLAQIFLSGCSEPLPKIDKITSSFNLINQNDEQIDFPGKYKGNILVIGYIFTNCPDICPLTTNNMRLIKEKLQSEGISDIKFVSISFDPERDRPGIFRKFIRMRNLDTNNWDFLTGDKPEIDSLIRNAGIVAVPTDTVEKSNGDEIVFYAHTDRISLYDGNGYLRKNYPGSRINIDEIVNDIKLLGE